MKKLLFLALLFLVACNDSSHSGEELKVKGKTLMIQKDSAALDSTAYNPKPAEAINLRDSVLSTVEKPKAVYHIKVDRYGSFSYYVINFTNDNWKTSQEALRFLPYTKAANPLFNYKYEAIEYAKRLNTYEKAIANNKRVARMAAQAREEDKPVSIY